MAILGPKQWVTPLEKCQLFEYRNFLFLLPKKASFNLEYRKSNFLNLECLKKICEKNGHIFTKTMA